MTDIAALSKEQLSQEIARLMAQVKQQEQTIHSLQHQIHLFRTARFGRKTEKGIVPEQMVLQFVRDVKTQ